jgi:saccharopine dehydrogenase-like NADP-dependent oxidoreductase
MRVVVCSCGTQASDVARYIRKHPAISHLIVADANAEAARALAAEIDAEAAVFDATDANSVRGLLAGANLVFNGVGPFYRFAIPIVEAAIAAGAHYVDINDDEDVARKLVLDDKYDLAAKKAGVTVLIGAGSSPGLTNVMARLAASELDSTESIGVYWGTDFRVTYSPGISDHMFHILTDPSVQFIDGRHVEMAPGAGAETIRMVPPFGTYEFAYSGHAEPITIPRFIPGLRQVTVKSTFWQEGGNSLYRTLGRYGLGDAQPIAGLGLSPRDFMVRYLQTEQARDALTLDTSSAPHGPAFRVVANGTRGGRPAQVAYEMHMIRENLKANLTAFPASVAIHDLLAGEITIRGVVAPEACIDPKPYLRRITEGVGSILHHVVTTDETSTTESVQVGTGASS